jgi:uncharacterized protein (TIGR02271 family)
MPSETIVAVYDTPAHAELAIADLQGSGIPTGAIQHYAGTIHDVAQSDAIDQATASRSHTSPATGGGFWSWLTGEEEGAAARHEVYDRSLQGGSTVVTVVSESAQVEKIISILETHDPVDLEERAADFGLAGNATTGSVGRSLGAMGAIQSAATGTNTVRNDTTTQQGAGTEEVIPLSEEHLQVGKREVDRGTTRVRRYVVERPVEEQVRLRDETVSVFRRPVSASSAVGADAFTDRTVEVHESTEQAVVAKTARVVEEVVVQKDVSERDETIRDTVRREEVEITGPHAGTTSARA